MDCHQILSGACNAGDRCFAIGSVEGIPFTAYAAGCNIVVLASTFERVQIIPGATHNYIRISALDCSTDTGKIAAAYENKVCIFEPTPLIHNDQSPSHGLEYRWVQTGTLQACSHISSLSWNLEGTRLLTGGTNIQMWHERLARNAAADADDCMPSAVTFEIGDRDPRTPPIQLPGGSSIGGSIGGGGGADDKDATGWECVWKCQTATPVHHMAFSPDGTLFATSGKSDRLVKVWYENKHLLFPNKSLDHAQFGAMSSANPADVNYGFVYIAHPRAVTHISWRKTSKYMPKGSVSNMLVTSCLDNICRIWIETVLPDDGLVNMNQFDPLATQNPKFRTHRHKHRFMQRLKHMKTCFHIRRHAKHHAGGHHGGGVGGGGGGGPMMSGSGASFGGPGAGMEVGHSPIPSLPSTYSVHDFHSYGYHGTGVTPGLHFHLAASINAETDIPLVPSMQSSDPATQPNFILHWLNNKEMHFSLQAEAILRELTKKVIEKEQFSGGNGYAHGVFDCGGGGGSGIVSEQAQEAHEDQHQYVTSSTVPLEAHRPVEEQPRIASNRRPLGKSHKSFSHDDNSNSDEHPLSSHRGGIGSVGGHHTMSNTTSLNSLATDNGGGVGGAGGGAAATAAGMAQHNVPDALDMKIECLLRDWHHSPDLLFSIHPIDGSYLIWVVEWLDEYHPGSFRQAQVSFSTRIPSGFPLGDAMSMSTTVSLYNTGTNLLHFMEMVKGVKPTAANGTNGLAAPNGTNGDGTNAVGESVTPLPSVLEENETEWPSAKGAGHTNDDDDDDDRRSTDTGRPSQAGSARGKNKAQAESEASGAGSPRHDLSAVCTPSPTISMVTKHSNGTLNLWQLTFADKTKFTQVLSIGHVSRASGHRFRVNDITCHPVLPLLLTTSHHNIPDIPTHSPPMPGKYTSAAASTSSASAGAAGGPFSSSGDDANARGKDVCVPVGFCSELILWRVDAVGPLSQSGGVSELARINSLQRSAFSNVAWIPTLLPSTTLGSLSNSPSACFVASDGECLRIYQAVIDARTLLAEVSSSERLAARLSNSMVSLSTNDSSEHGAAGGLHGLQNGQTPLHNKIKIVSQQSTARPGCIIQLDGIADATHDWQNTQFLHVFQEQLITGERSGGVGGSAPTTATYGRRQSAAFQASTNEPDFNFIESQMGAMVDLQQNAEFEEPFYIVLIERTTTGSTIHMWRIVIASQTQQSDEADDDVMYVPDSNLVQDLDEPEPGPRHSIAGLHSSASGGFVGASAGGGGNDQQQSQPEAPHVSITTTKVCTQELPLPDGVDVVHAAPAAGHLSSSSIYPACFAPYIIVTACSDSTSRFWRCKITKPDQQQQQADQQNNLDPMANLKYHWCEWDMMSRDRLSTIEITGQPLHISAAYSGRIACAYKYGKSFTRPHKGDPDSRYVNLCVAIYECESTGGSEWILEDTIHLKNVHLPRIHMDPHLDLSYLHDNRFLQKKQRINQVLHTFNHDESRSPRNGETTPDGLPKSSLLAVPSFSTLQSLRKSITENGNTCPLTQKHLVQLDWVSKEDGSHILTVAVGSKVLLYTPVSSDLAQANIKAMKESQSTNRPILRKASSLAQPNFNEEIRWMKLRQIDLSTADGLPPLPMQMSWVRDGILVVGMDSEMHVYTQWKSKHQRQLINGGTAATEESYDTRNLRDEDLRSMAHENSQRRLANVSSMPHLSRVSSMNLQMLNSEKKKKQQQQQQNMAHSSSSGAHLGSSAAGGAANCAATADAIPDYMPDYGLFEASRIACPVLPQYHPKQLMELLNSGKIRWVKAILAHLVRCISGTYSVRSLGGDEESLSRQRGWSRSRTFSVSYAAGTSGNNPNESRGSTAQMPEEVTLDYAEITSIPPLPLWTLLEADKEMLAAQNEEKKDYNELFDDNIGGEESLDELLEHDEGAPGGADKHQRFDRRSSVPERQSLSHFGPRQGQMLSRLLTHTHLPGLSSLDQMHLLALADTVATCNTDFAERFLNDAARTAIAKENLTGVAQNETVSSDSLDDCGLRFLLAMKHFGYLLRCLPLVQRNQIQRQGIASSNLVWAFHSESEEEMLNLIPSYAKNQARWSTLKELGVGWWLRNTTQLRLCVERLAKAAFQAKQDPLDAALYYIAMKKKSVVWGLFRSRRDEKMTAFFANNFAEDRWRKSALKNAFALLGKQRFEHAVAFFLLANSLNDAIEVCLTKLNDLQLALVIARLYEGEHDATPPSYRKLLYEEVLGCDRDGNNADVTRAHPDPFLRSMALWLLKDYSGSLNTLLLNNVGQQHKAYGDGGEYDTLLSKPESSQSATNPNVFNFYIYLRTHPLLIRQYIASTAQEKKKAQVVLSGFSYSGDGGAPGANGGGPNIGGGGGVDKQVMIEDSITPLERQLYFTTAHGHFKAGCPALALEVLSKLPAKVVEQESSASVATTPGDGTSKTSVQIDTGILHWNTPATAAMKTTAESSDWSAPAAKPAETADSMDWGAPVAKPDDGGFKLEWDDDGDDKSDDDDDDDDGGLALKLDQPAAAAASKTAEAATPSTASSSTRTETLDIMAQQLKFVACLKILMEELSTLATGFEVDGGQLRYQLYVWLEKEVEALKQLCNYSDSTDIRTGKHIADDKSQSTAQMDDPTSAGVPPSYRTNEKPTLHEILMQEKQDFEAKVQRAARRKRWLKVNQTLLRTLLSYCSLHGASGGGLASVRMELVLLLQELQQEKTRQQLLSPLPFPTTLPLLSACIAGNKTVIADPIRYLQSQTQDMLQTIVDIRMLPISFQTTGASEIFVLRDLAVALSACIYQSLCDSDNFIVKQYSEQCAGGGGYQSPGMETLAKLNASCQSSHLMANAGGGGGGGGGGGIGSQQRRRKYSSDEPVAVSTLPSKWPGVTNLRALLARERDEDTPRLNVLLCEAFVATFMSLLVYALSTCDCHILYRLAGHRFTNASWANLFGGGIKKLLRKATSQIHLVQQQQQQQAQSQPQPQQPGTSTSAAAAVSAFGMSFDQGASTDSATGTPLGDGGMWNTVTSLTKQRVKLNMKLLGNFSGSTGAPNMKEDKPTYREQFVSPEMSMVSYFLIKPTVHADPDDVDYDSADSLASDDDNDDDEEDVFADPLSNDTKATHASEMLKKHRRENSEHSNPHSYSWYVIRLAVMKLCQQQLQEFVGIAGIEMQELPVASPLIHGILRTMAAWQDLVREELALRGPAPPNYIPGCFVETEAKGPAIHKYRSLLDKQNTPFSPVLGSALPAIRLWNYLVRQDTVQEIFIRAVFGKKRPSTATVQHSSGGGGGSGGCVGGDASDSTTTSLAGDVASGDGSQYGSNHHHHNAHVPEPVRIIHKEQESISAFCLNLQNPGLLALATPRECQEMDISLLLESPNWLEDECELDIMNLNRDIDKEPASGFLMIQASSDKYASILTANTAQNYAQPSSPQPGIAGQSGRGASVIKGATFPGSHDPQFCKLVIDRSKHLLRPVLKHKVDNIKRMCAHPLMPLYLTGGQDGSVQMWEWGHQQVVCTPRPPGTFAKVTRCRFAQHGNKFGIADGDGNLSLWQAGLQSQHNRPFFTYQCHNKGITDFVFLGSCSLVATAGHSSESKNVGMWDTLLPQKKSLVASFTCHEQGASSLVYAPQHQLLISAGKKGDVCIFDVRQRVLRDRFPAHESAIKCLAIDPHEEHFVTGSADGDIKVWGLAKHSMLYSFPGEHARSSFFKHIGQGVTQLQVDGHSRLFSCGADGSMKVRQLPDRESIVHSLY